MASLAFTVTIPPERVQEFRDLLEELAKDISGLEERARAIGYHRERMWLQPGADGSAQLITYLELDEGVDPSDFQARLQAYDSEFTRWWNPRYGSFLGGHPQPSATLFSWDDSKPDDAKP